MKRLARKLARLVFHAVVAPCFLAAALVCRKKRRSILWGTAPIMNNKYWCKAMQRAGWESKTLMHTFFGDIHRREDYDLYFGDLVPEWVPFAALRAELAPYFAFLYVLENAAVLNCSFLGGPLGETPFWRLEAQILKWFSIKMVVIPYGADAYMYSRVNDTSVRNGLLACYPDAARNEPQIRSRVEYWSHHADAMVVGFLMDGMPRWDVAVCNPIAIDTEEWAPKSNYSEADGRNGAVKVLHAPNHRGFKGTEFLIQAISELQEEGLQVELVLMEKRPNQEVRAAMQEVDILADQFIATAYALNAIEGMASGLPVLANLDDEWYTRVMRRYAYLDECPILSTGPESLKDNLRALICDPSLRRELGLAGRAFVEKYHSFDTAQYLFGKIYERIIEGKDIALIDLFHPLKSDYNRSRPRVQHPLVENHLPGGTLHRDPTG